MDSIKGQLWRFRHAALAVALVVVGAGAVLWLLRETVGGLSQLDPNFASAIIAAFAGLVVVVLGQIFNRSRQISEAHREKKVEMYGKFVQLLIDLQQATRLGGADELMKDKQTEANIVDFNRDVLLWGSPTVIRAVLDFGRVATGPFLLVRMDNLIGAIRKDLGLSNWRLRKGDLVKLFLKDPDEFDQMLRQENQGGPE